MALKVTIAGESRDYERALGDASEATDRHRKQLLALRTEQLRAEEAENRLTKATQKYGAESLQARKAALALEKAQEKVALQHRISAGEFDNATGSLSEYRNQTRGAADDSDRLGMILGKVGRQTRALAEPVAKIAAIGGIAGGLSAAGAGAAALVSGLAPLAGVAASGAAGAVAVATSTKLIKVATQGLDASLEGVFDEFSKATPVTDALARQLGELVPELLHMRNLAQGRILGGVIDGVQAARPLLGQLTPELARTSSALGELARDAGALAPELGQELAKILHTNVGLIDDVGHAGLNTAVVFVRVLDAARPLTTFLGETALAWSASAKEAANAGARTGELTGFFEGTVDVLKIVLPLAGDVAGSILNIASAGGPLGRDLLGSLAKTADEFERFTGSADGQNQIRAFFEDAREPIYAVAELVRDATGSIIRLGSGADLAPLINQVRTDLLPVIERVVGSTTEAFGPVAVSALVAFAQAFEPLIGSSGPLVLYVKALTGLANAAVFIQQNVPGASYAITALFGALAVSKAANLLAVTTGLRAMAGGVVTLTALVRVQRGATLSAAAAERVATASRAQGVIALGLHRGATVASTIASRGLAVGARAAGVALAFATGPIGLTILAVAALGAALVIAYRKSDTFRSVVDKTFTAAKRIVGDAISFILGGLDKYLGGISSVLSAAGKIPGIGGKFRAAARGIDEAREKIRGVASSLDDLGEKKVTKVKVKVDMEVVDAAGKAIKNIGWGDGLGRTINRGAADYARRNAPKTMALSTGVGSPSSSLAGANSALRPIASVGFQRGLRVSSGKRAAGGRTSSGGISYHGTGEAVDLAGTPAAMLSTFRALKSSYGPRLAELIYTPGGAGIKNGRPYTYTGAVAADHYDHVHAALDLGPPGPGVGGRRDLIGDGLGKFDSTSYGPPWGGIQGTGVTRTGVNLKGGPQVYGIAVDPSKIRLGSSVYVNPNPFGYKGRFKAFDTGGAIKGNRIDFYDWRGRKAQMGWGRRPVTVSTASGEGDESLDGPASSGGTAGGPAASRISAASPAQKALSANRSIARKQRAGNVASQTEARKDREAEKGFFTFNGLQEAIDKDAADKQAVADKIVADRSSRSSSRNKLAGLTDTLEDDLAAVFADSADAWGDLVSAEGKFGKGSAEATAAFADWAVISKQHTDLLKAQAEQMKEIARQPFRDAIAGLNDDLIRAQVDTPDDKTDDLAVVTRQLTDATAGYQDAIRRGDEAAISEFGGQVLSLRGDLKTLQDAIEENTSAVAQAVAEFTAELKRQNDLASSQIGVQNSTLVKALADLLSGEIVGVALQGRGQTAGAGSTVRY